MEIGEEERYAAGALFTLALHLTQVQKALLLHSQACRYAIAGT